MVVISLYRGNLHRVPDAPRRWAMPPQALSLRHFELLTRRRALALARLPLPPPVEEKKVPEEKGKEEGMGDSGCPKHRPAPAPEPTGGSLSPRRDADGDGEGQCPPSRETKSLEAAASLPAGESGAPETGGGPPTAEAQMEISKNFDNSSEKEEKKKELEKKLHILNEKKHHLVQMLKQILNAEEEIKKRSIQQSGIRACVPLPGDIMIDMGSVTKPVPKLSIDVNICNDLNGESDAAANHNSHARHLHLLHTTSPSATSALNRNISVPFQQNSVLYTPRGSLVASGHGQTSSNILTSSVGASPSRFAPTAHQSHPTNLPPVSISGSQFVASSPSPAASGGTSSVFRDSRLTSPSWN